MSCSAYPPGSRESAEAGELKKTVGREQPDVNVNPYVNVGKMERVASALTGAGLLVSGLRRLNSLTGLALAVTGGALLRRGLSGHCNCYQAIGMSTARRHSPAIGVPARHGAKMEQSITVDCSSGEAYRAWRELTNLPRFFRHLTSVTPIDERRSHWVARGPFDIKLEWDAEIINDRANEIIAWRSYPGSNINTAGSVHFVPAREGRATEVRVSLKYEPPGGKLGISLAKLLGDDPELQFEEDLHTFKSLIESGELGKPQPAGQPSGRTEIASKPAERPAGEPHAKQALTEPKRTEFDRVEEASEESFPASDAPGWTQTAATRDSLGSGGKP